MFAEKLADEDQLAEQSTGIESIKQLVAGFAPEITADRTGIDPQTVRELARTLVITDRAAIYGRIGTSLGRAGTLTTALLDIVNLVAGNLDVVGGSMFGDLGIPGQRLAVAALQHVSRFAWNGRRSRVGDL